MGTEIIQFTDLTHKKVEYILKKGIEKTRENDGNKAGHF